MYCVSANLEYTYIFHVSLTKTHQLHSHPEVLFQEHHAHKILTEFLEARGFQVQRKAFGLDTAFKASFGSEAGRTVVVNLE